MAAQELNDIATLYAKASYYWRFEGNSNSTVGSNNGTDTDISYSTTNAAFGQRAGFNGTSSGIALASAINGVVQGDKNFSISAWIYLTGAPGLYQGCIIESGDFNGANAHWTFGVSYVGGVYNGLEGGENGATVSFSFSLNTLYHVAWTHASDGTSLYYVDGNYIGTLSDNNFTSTFAPHIGRAEYTPNFWFNGNIDDLSIFNSVLSSTEIKLLATGISSTGTNGSFLINFL